MTPEQEERIREIMREEMSGMLGYVFSKHIQILDGRNIQVGQTTGTKIGLDTTSKLSVLGATPVVQASAISAPTAPGATYLQSEAASAKTAIDAIRTAIKNFGITA